MPAQNELLHCVGVGALGGWDVEFGEKAFAALEDVDAEVGLVVGICVGCFG